MNLTLIKELLVIYRNDASLNAINESKLASLCDKVKLPSVSRKTSSKNTKNPTQLAPACWNLLVQINRLPSSAFSSQKIFLITAKIILACGRNIESARNDLKMGPFDLDKILANLVSKLSESLKTPITQDATVVIQLFEFIFEKLHNHLNLLENGLRRMSIAEGQSFENLFIDVKFQSLSPESINDPIIKQICIIGLESLCRTVILFQKGPLEDILDILTPFHLNIASSDSENSIKFMSHFISSVTKLEFYCQLEWKFWNHLCKFKIYKQFLGYFKKRCTFPLSTPNMTDISNLNIKLILFVIETGQLTDIMLRSSTFCEDFSDDEIIGSSLNLLLAENFHVYIHLIETIIEKTPKHHISDSGLRYLLPALDSLRNSMFRLIRNDQVFKLLLILNDSLLKLNFPVKYYVSWTSCILKFAIDQKKYSNISNLIKKLISGLLQVFDEIPNGMKSKVEKIISQTISVAGDCELLNQFSLKFESSLFPILESSRFNLSQEYFIQLSFLVQDKFDVALSWVSVLSNQNQVTSKAFQFSDIYFLHHLAKIISKQIFDQFKSSQYLHFIYDRMVELGCDLENISLSKQLLSLINQSVPKPDHMFSDVNLQNSVNFLKHHQDTGQLNFDHLIFKDVIINTRIEEELYDEVFNLIFVHAPKDTFDDILKKFDCTDSTVNWLKCLEANSTLIQGPNVKMVHSLYLQGEFSEALKKGYEKLKLFLKSSTANTLESTKLIVYLFRLAVSTRNLSEARYFLKQIFLLSETLKSENIRKLAESLQLELSSLTGTNSSTVDYIRCEKLLASAVYQPFEFEYKNLMELDKIRNQIRLIFQSQFSIGCNGIKAKSLVFDSVLNEIYKKASTFLKESSNLNLHYCISQWAKVLFFLMFHKSLHCDCDLELLRLFEIARNSNNFNFNFQVDRLTGSIGLLHDPFLSILWVLIVSIDSKVLVFKMNINGPELAKKLQKILEICSQNTDSLKNTKEIALDSEKKSNWWKLRRSLDSDLTILCNELNNDLFSNLTELLIPCSATNLISRNLFKNINDLVEKLFGPESIHFTKSFVGQLTQWGQFPKRFELENLVKMIKFSLNFNSTTSDFNLFGDQLDSLVVKLRNCFESSFENFTIDPSSHCFNLLLDKDLNIVPFESLFLFNKFAFKRVPFIISNRSEPHSIQNEALDRVFYIINPSGDLNQTQERFGALFASQPNWKGIIGRKPTIDEFFDGICGNFDLFIYFGHSGGEIYAPLKDLKLKLPENKRASSALLIGCSSGKIKSNGVFPVESSIFHYLENESPFILANLWDVTDKDIDIYIKSVLEDSDLILPIGSKALSIQSTASYDLIIEKAQMNRQKCYLKALNGYAPIVYGVN